MSYGLKVMGNLSDGSNYTIADSTLDLLNYRVVTSGRASFVNLDFPLGENDFIFVKSPAPVTGSNWTPINVDNIYGDVTVYSPDTFYCYQSGSDMLNGIVRFKGRGYAAGGYQNNTFVTADWDVIMDYFVVRDVESILENSSVLNDDEYGLQIRTAPPAPTDSNPNPEGRVCFDSRALITNDVFHIETYLAPSQDWTVFGDPLLNFSSGCYVNLEWSLGSNLFGNTPTTDLFGLRFNQFGTQVQYVDSVLINYGRYGAEIYQNFRNLNALFAAKLEASSSGSSQEEESANGSLQFSSVDNITEGQSISLQATTNETGDYHVKVFRISGSDGVAQRDFVDTSSTFTGTSHTATFTSYNSTTSYNVTMERTGSFTRQSVVDIATGFNRDFIGNTIANYIGDFTGNYTRLSTYTRTSTRTISYTGDYLRTVDYEGIYTQLSTKNSTRTSTYERSYSDGLSFEGNYSRFYTGTIYYNWNPIPNEPEGRLEITYRPGTYTETYQRTRPSNYAGTYTRTRIPNLATSKTFTRTSTRTRLSAYSRVSSRTRVSSYERQRPSDFTRTLTYIGNFQGNFIGDYVRQVNYNRYRYSITSTRQVPYQRTSTRARLSTYDGTYTRTRISAYTRTRDGSGSTRTFVGNYQRGFVGNYTRTITYAGEFSRTRTSVYASLADYIRTRVESYEGGYSRTFIGNYSRNFAGNYGRTFVGNYSRNFAGNYSKPSTYSRTFVGNFTGGASYEGNYERTRTSAYERTRVSGGSDPFSYSIVNGSPQYVWRISRVAEGGGFGDGRGDVTYEYYIELYYSGLLRYTSSPFNTMAAAQGVTTIGPVSGTGKYYHRGTLEVDTVFVKDYEIAENTSTSTPTASQNFVGNYTRDFVGNYERIRSIGTSSTRNRVSSYTGTLTYIGNYSRAYNGDYSRSYVGNYSRAYNGNYSRSYLGHYIRSFVGNVTKVSSRFVYDADAGGVVEVFGYYTRNFVGDTSRLSTKTSGRVVTRYSTYLKNRVSTYTPGFLGNYERGFVSEYTGTYNRNFFGQYTGNYERTGFYTSLYTGDFVGPSTRQVVIEGYVGDFPVNYSRTSTRTSTRNRNQEFSYAGTFTGNYNRDFGGNFEGNYLRSFVGDFIGDYTGTYSRSPSYEGNYEGNYIRDIVDSYNRYPISYYTRVSSRTDIRVTAFSRVLSFIGEYTGNFAGNYTRDFTDTRNYVRTPSYLGNYANYVPSTRNSTRTSTRDFTGTRSSSYSDGAKTYYTGEYIGNYTKVTTIASGDSELGWQGETFLAQLRSGSDTSSVNAVLGSNAVEVLAEREFTLYDNDSGIFTTTTNRIIHPDDTSHQLIITHLTEGSDVNAVQMRVYRGSALILSDVAITTGLNTFTVNEVPPAGSSYDYTIQAFNGQAWISAGAYSVTKPNQVDPTSSNDNSEPPPQNTDTSSSGTWWKNVVTYTSEMEEMITTSINWEGVDVYNSGINGSDYSTVSISSGGFTYIRGDLISSEYQSNYQIHYYQVTRS